MTTVKTMVWNRRIEVPAPSDIPDGTEVTLTIAHSDQSGPVPNEEIGRVLSAMQKLGTWSIPEEVASDLDVWERKINQHGIEHRDSGAEDVFP
jgi:hypothetical protein